MIGDVVGSRGFTDRFAFQQRLQATTEATNELARPELASPFTVTLGDEVQAVYRAAGGVIDHVLYFMGGVSPRRMRFAIGVGSLSTPLNAAQAIGMDGPAFHAARDGLEDQKRSGTGCSIWTASGWSGPQLATADVALRLLSIEVARWRPARWRVVERLIEGLSETEAAATLGLSRQAINRHVHAGAVRAVREAARQIEADLTIAMRHG